MARTAFLARIAALEATIGSQAQREQAVREMKALFAELEQLTAAAMRRNETLPRDRRTLCERDPAFAIELRNFEERIGR
jgi:hypothetical protein